MSPNRRNYKDGVDDGNSDWSDRDRFQKDNDYYDGVRDGWREKESRAEQARDDATQKMLDRADKGYDSSSISSGGNYSEGLSCGVSIGLFFASVFIAGLFTPVLTPFVGPLWAPTIPFGIALYSLIFIAKAIQSK